MKELSAGIEEAQHLQGDSSAAGVECEVRVAVADDGELARAEGRDLFAETVGAEGRKVSATGYVRVGDEGAAGVAASDGGEGFGRVDYGEARAGEV